jgi:serine/threonine-protein kinase
MIGTMIGSLRIAEALGDGGVGSVYRAVDLSSGDQSAIRIFSAEVTRDAALVERLRAIVPALKRLHHPNVAAVYDVMDAGGHFGFRLEYVTGLTLEDTRGAMGRLDTNAAVSYAAQALRGLEHAHRAGVYHHALRPTNIMVTPHGGVKVMDVGIGHALGANRKTREDRLAAVLAYLAPEQAQNQPGDARSDIYAAGVVLYELLTGHRPFAHRTEFAVRQALLFEPVPSPRTLAADVPDWVEQAVMRALSKNPAQRYQSATEMCAVLEAGLRLTAVGTTLLAREPSGAEAPTAILPALLTPVATEPGPVTPAGLPSDHADATVHLAPPPAGPGAGGRTDETVSLTQKPQAVPPVPVHAESSDATVVVPSVPGATPPGLPPNEPQDATVIVTVEPRAVPLSPPLPGASANAPTARAEAPARGAGAAAPGASVETAVTGPQPVAAGVPLPPGRPAGAAPRRAPADAARTDAGGRRPAGGAPPLRQARSSWRRPAVLAMAAILVLALGAAAAVYWTVFRVAAPVAEPDSSEAAVPSALEPTVAGTASAAPAAAAPAATEPPVAPAATSTPERALAPPPDSAQPPVTTQPATAQPPAAPVPGAAGAPPEAKRTAKPKPRQPPPAVSREPVPVIIEPPPATEVQVPPVAAEPPPPPVVEQPKAPPPPDVSFLKVKLMVGQGEATREIDVNLLFLEDRIGVAPERGGATLRTVRYQDVVKASYQREQRRRLFGRSARHLLTIDTSTEPLVLRLDQDNVDAILRAFEAHAHMAVQR